MTPRELQQIILDLDSDHRGEEGNEDRNEDEDEEDGNVDREKRRRINEWTVAVIEADTESDVERRRDNTEREDVDDDEISVAVTLGSSDLSLGEIITHETSNVLNVSVSSDDNIWDGEHEE